MRIALGRRHSRAELSEAAEAEEEVDLMWTIAPITVLRPRAGEA